MNQSQLNLIISAKDLASSVMTKVGASLDEVKSKATNLAEAGFGKMNETFTATADIMKTGLLFGMTTAAAVFGLLGGVAVKNSANFEQYRATLTVMLGSQELANKRLQEYADIGAKTPFQLPQVVELGNHLQAIGKYSRDNVNMLGDLATAAGKPIEQVSAAFSKLATGQKGIAVDMFHDLLITTEDWTKATGKGVTKNGELMATTEEMMAVLPKIMADKKFLGMMEGQGQTFIVKMSNLVDAWNGKLQEVGEKILPAIKPYIDQLTTYIGSIDLNAIFNAIQAIFQLLTSGGKEAMVGGMWIDQLFGQGTADKIAFVSSKINEFYNFITSGSNEANAVLFGLATVIGTILLGSVLVLVAPLIEFIALWGLVGAVAGGLFYLFQTNTPLFYGVATAIGIIAITILAGYVPAMWAAATATFAATWPIIAIAVASGLLVAAIVWLVQNWDWLKSKAIEIFGAIKNWISEKFEEIKNNIWRSFDNIKRIDLFQAGKDIIQGLVNGIRSMGSAVGNAISGLIRGHVPSNVRDFLKNTPGEVGGFFQGIPGFASGVNNFGGGMAIVGEQGPELVQLPRGSNVYSNGQSNQMMGGNITNNFYVTGGNTDEIVDQIIRILAKNNRDTNLGMNNAYA